MHPFEELAFFFANVFSQFLSENCQALQIELTCTRMSEKISQEGMFRQEFFYEWLQVRETRGCRKQCVFFRCEMNSNFTFELLLDFRLPGFEIHFARANGAIEAHA